MGDLGLSAGLAALAFCGFIAAVSVASIWDGVRKREAKHETVRRLIESGQPIDQELIDKVLMQNVGSKHYDQDFKVTALWILPIAVGLAVFGYFMGQAFPDVLVPLLSVSAMLACFGVGFLLASKIAARWYQENEDSALR